MKTVICFAAFCLVAVYAATECQKRRQQALDRPLLGQLVPQCEENGDFAALQCHHDRFCQCWARDGSPLTQPSGQIKHCDCVRQRAEVTKASENGIPIIGAFVPTCRPDGFFESKQCWGSTGQCWCADKLGNKLSEPSRVPLNC